MGTKLSDLPEPFVVVGPNESFDPVSICPPFYLYIKNSTKKTILAVMWKGPKVLVEAIDP